MKKGNCYKLVVEYSVEMSLSRFFSLNSRRHFGVPGAVRINEAAPELMLNEKIQPKVKRYVSFEILLRKS